MVHKLNSHRFGSTGNIQANVANFVIKGIQ